MSRSFLGALLLLGCGSAPPAPIPPEAARVRALTLQARDVSLEEEWGGTAEGRVHARVGVQTNGALLRQAYQDGTFVRRGQLLFQLEDRPARAALDQAEAQRLQAQGDVLRAQSQKRAAQVALQQARDQKSQAQAALQLALGQLDQAIGGLAEARAHQQRTALDEAKIRPLLDQEAVTQQELDNATQLHEAAKAQVLSATGQVRAAEGARAAAQAQIRLAQSSIQAAQAQLGVADANLLSSQGQLLAARAAIGQARIQLDYTKILSPIDGVAGVARVQVGDLLQAQQSQPLVEISQVDPIKIAFSLPQSKLPALDWGKAAFSLSLADGQKYPHPGRFLSQDSSVASGTGSVKITLLFPNPKHLIKPGQFVRINLRQGKLRQAILVPQTAIFALLDRDQVAVVGADHKVQHRSVQLGPMVGDQRVVQGGLAAGEVVVLDGSQSVPAGALAEVIE